MATNSQHQAVPAHKQSIQKLAEAVVTTRLEAVDAEAEVHRTAARAREATYRYVECLEAKLKAAGALVAA